LDTSSIIITVLIFALLLAAMFVIPGLRLKRAIRQVIQIFRKHNATDVKNAKSDNTLGLKPRPMLERMFSLRDYKPYGLTVLIRAGIVLQTEDGKLYLSEDKLMASRLDRGISQRR
jgi:hypothetical protein